MSGRDPYEAVLNLAPGPRPPSHYVLLGLKQFESDQSVIAAAADARAADAEESVLASAAQIQQVVEEIRAAKACLLDRQAKAEYDRALNSAGETIGIDRPVLSTHTAAGRPVDEPGTAQDPDFAASPFVGFEEPEAPHDLPHGLPQDAPHDLPQFDALPADLVEGARPVKKRKSRRWFWVFTLIEGAVIVGLYFWLHPQEPVEMPRIAVRRHPQNEEPRRTPTRESDVPPTSQPQGGQEIGPRQPLGGQQRPTGRPAERPAAIAPEPATAESIRPDDLPAPDNRPNAEPPPDDASPPSSEDGKRAAEAMPAPSPAPAKTVGEKSPDVTAPANSSLWPREWTIRFAANKDWSLDNEMLALSADELKAVTALREQPLYTVRDVGTKRPLAALPFDNQGHLSGLVLALFPGGGWHACLKYENQVLLGYSRFFDAGQRCAYLAEYRFKGRARMCCLCAEGTPIAVQIWRGKDQAAYLVELVAGQPVATEQKQLSPAQSERLAAALAEMATIDTLVRDSEREWKSQLSEWWRAHDTALKTISALSIDDGEKQSRKTAYYKKLFDEQHAGLDKLLAQFEPPAAATKP